ncbi:MAG: hypothetical protein QM817_22610 [Archangium sp.]
MPCIPSYHEQMWMQTETGFRVARQEIQRLIPQLEKAKIVVAQSNAPEREAWLVQADKLLAEARAPFKEPSSPDTQDGVEEAARLADSRRGLYQSLEAHVCTAGTLAWRAKPPESQPKTKEWKAVLTAHQRHREADRRAKIAELRRQLNDLERQYSSRMEAARSIVNARNEYFDDVTSREDAVRQEAGLSDGSNSTAQRSLRDEIARIESLTLDEICGDRTLF